jgi:hypothetical protein
VVTKEAFNSISRKCYKMSVEVDVVTWLSEIRVPGENKHLRKSNKTLLRTKRRTRHLQCKTLYTEPKKALDDQSQRIRKF